MKTIEVSDEVYAAFEGVRSRVDPSTAEYVLLFILSAWAASSPGTFDAQWNDIKKFIPETAIWQEWEMAVENLTGPIRKSAGVMGGAACIGNSRIPVWVLVSLKKQQMTDGELLRAYPSLQASDLEAAWGYYTVHSDEIDALIRAQREDDDLG